MKRSGKTLRIKIGVKLLDDDGKMIIRTTVHKRSSARAIATHVLRPESQHSLEFKVTYGKKNGEDLFNSCLCSTLEDFSKKLAIFTDSKLLDQIEHYWEL